MYLFPGVFVVTHMYTVKVFSFDRLTVKFTKKYLLNFLVTSYKLIQQLRILVTLKN